MLTAQLATIYSTLPMPRYNVATKLIPGAKLHRFCDTLPGRTTVIVAPAMRCGVLSLAKTRPVERGGLGVARYVLPFPFRGVNRR